MLYTVTVAVETAAGRDTLTQRTGFKYFEVRGRDFYLNGNPYFLRGYGDDFVWPMTAQPDAEEKSFYYPGLQRAKAYGFNAVRCHSHFPFEAYFEAADELGLLIQPELALANIPVDWLTEPPQRDGVVRRQRDGVGLLLRGPHHRNRPPAGSLPPRRAHRRPLDGPGGGR